MSGNRARLGHGVGLRPKHYQDFLQQRPPVDFIEATSENFLARGGRPVAVLEKVRSELPVVLHGVSLSIGAVDPLNETYLAQLAGLVDRVQPAMVSDHLCWGSHGGRYGHDLWPLPYTEEAIAHVTSRVVRVQELLRRSILLENVSSYVTHRASHLTEWDFLSEVAQRSGCGILLDINNIYVSARNHGFDPREYLRGVPPERVAQFHLAGHSDQGTHLLDTHDAPVADAVWALYREAVARFGPMPTLIEWDDHIPELPALLAESEMARALERQVLRGAEEGGLAWAS